MTENKARLWRKEPSGKFAWICLCHKCLGLVVILSDSDVEAPEVKECAGCVRIKEKKKRANIRTKR